MSFASQPTEAGGRENERERKSRVRPGNRTKTENKTKRLLNDSFKCTIEARRASHGKLKALVPQSAAAARVAAAAAVSQIHTA